MTDFETEKLLARWIAGETLAPAETQALREALDSRPKLLDAAADQVVLNRVLGQRKTSFDEASFVSEIRSMLEEPPAPGKIVPFHRTKWVWGSVAAAVAVIAAVVLVPRKTEEIAWVTGSTGAEGFENGRAFHRGEKLSFDSGFVSIRFAKGAEVVVEGKADMVISGPNKAKLERGSAVANVPESAHGFTIDGPGGRVVDVGTEFAVKTEGKEMEVHVLKGEVEAHPKGQKAVAIKEDNAALLGKNGLATLISAPGNFLTALPPKHDGSPLKYLHWSFDENIGLEAHASGQGGEDRSDTTGLLTSLPGSTIVPTWTKGVFGSAISFSGQDDYVQTEFPGFGGSSARTVACWVKVPKDLKTTEGYALVSWGAHSTPGDTWQVSINPDEKDGPLGSLRVGTHEGEVVGSTDLRDGEWHHLAAVLYEGRPANVATHILIYVDGRLESAARKSVMRINTDITGPMAQRVAFGKNSAVRTAANKFPKHTFRGDLDEVTLCPAALSQSEIVELMKSGKLK